MLRGHTQETSLFHKDNNNTTNSATAGAETARDADDVYLGAMDAPPKQTVLTNRETAIQGHSRSYIVVPIDAAYMTS